MATDSCLGFREDTPLSPVSVSGFSNAYSLESQSADGTDGLSGAVTAESRECTIESADTFKTSLTSNLSMMAGDITEVERARQQERISEGNLNSRQSSPLRSLVKPSRSFKDIFPNLKSGYVSVEAYNLAQDKMPQGGLTDRESADSTSEAFRTLIQSPRTPRDMQKAPERASFRCDERGAWKKRVLLGLLVLSAVIIIVTVVNVLINKQKGVKSMCLDKQGELARMKFVTVPCGKAQGQDGVGNLRGSVEPQTSGHTPTFVYAGN